MKISRTTAMVLAGLMLSAMTAVAQPVTETDAAVKQGEQAAASTQGAVTEKASETVQQVTGEVEAAGQTMESGAAKWAAKAAMVLEVQMADMPDKRIPEAVTEHARCVAIFPSVLKAGFVIGAKRGDGLITCRDDQTGTWGAPAFFRMKGVSWGLQIGAQSADVIIMIMNQEGVDGLLKAKVSLGGDIGVSAGPVGRNVSVSTDLLLKSPMISYARSKGIFAGFDLEGSTITYNQKENEKQYGQGMDASTILFKTAAVPEDLQVFHAALTVYAPQLKQVTEAQPEAEAKEASATETTEQINPEQPAQEQQ